MHYSRSVYSAIALHESATAAFMFSVVLSYLTKLKLRIVFVAYPNCQLNFEGVPTPYSLRLEIGLLPANMSLVHHEIINYDTIGKQYHIF